jgi:hypothetical protein
MGTPSFEGGEVPKAAGALDRLRSKLAKCIDDHGGLSARTTSVKVQFLVRAEGRAEGVDVLEAKALSADAKRCVRDTLQRTKVGTPSSDPVGVTVVLDVDGASGQP